MRLIHFLKLIFRKKYLTFIFSLLALVSMSIAHADKVNILNKGAATATGTVGKPTLSNFNIPSGKNRMLLILVNFERDHCDLASDNCKTTTASTPTLSDNFAGLLVGTDRQVTARVAGVSTLDKMNALAIGGTPSGDLRYIFVEANSSSGGVSIAGTTRFSEESYFIGFNESEINTLLGGATSGNVTISFPLVTASKSAGDDAIVQAIVFENVEQTDSGMVRSSSLGNSNLPLGVASNSSIAINALDAGQAPDDANDGILFYGMNTTPDNTTNGGFSAITGFTGVLSTITTNTNGLFDNSSNANSFNYHREPDGLAISTQFRNGVFSAYTATSSITAAATPSNIAGIRQSTFTLSAYNPDVSDAPASYGVARHQTNASAIRLGASVDTDTTDLSSTDATKDDTTGSDDEDGVTFGGSFSAGTSTTVTASIQTAAGYLNMWVDWNRDGDFLDSGEQVVSESSVAVGTSTFNITPPTGTKVGSSFARIRVCTTTGSCNTPTGDAMSGEVEDYTVTLDNVAPVITSDGGGATATITVNENTTTVTTVTATDANSDTLTFSLNGGTDAAKFSINSSTGALTFNTAPNYEAPTDSDGNNTYVVTVRVSDGNGGTDDQTITVTIKDVLEGLTCSGYSATVYDPATTTTGWTDPYNINPVGSFSYKEFSNKPTWMSIDTNWANAAQITDGVGDDAGYTGTALTTSNFDYSVEFKKIITAAEAGNYRFYLTMGDDHVKIYRNGTLIYSKQNGYSGVPVEALASQALAAGDELTIVSIEEQSTNTRLSIQITPLFTNPCNAAPVITSNGSGATAAVSAPENQTAVTTVTATDADADTVTFSITGGADSAKFAINATTGVLTFVTAPNFEVPTDSGANNVYDVQVTASDPNGGTDVQAIAVTVTNVNEAPTITSNGGGDTASISMGDNQTAVTTVTATDPDSGDTLGYSITGGTDSAKFTINATTGALAFSSAPDYFFPSDSDGNNIYQVMVQASDGKGGVDTQTINITITSSGTGEIRGTIFEDVNYGGGAGRSLSSASGVGVGSTRVELYTSTGVLMATRTTASTGTYTFNSLRAGSYYVRVVNETVNSSRTGSDGTELGVQTFRTNGSTAVTNEVGGRVPAIADAASNTTSQTLNTTSFALSGGGQAQSVQPITLSTNSTVISGADFGFNFDTIVNTNNSGQGSIDQFIINSNLLGNTGLDQAANANFDPQAGHETSIFMIPATDPKMDASGVATINHTGMLTSFSAPDTHMNAYTQAGAKPGVIGARTLKVRVVSSGTNNFFNLTGTAHNTLIAGFNFDDFKGVNVQTPIANLNGAENLSIRGNYIGTLINGSAGIGVSTGISFSLSPTGRIGVDLNSGSAISNDGMTDDQEGNLIGKARTAISVTGYNGKSNGHVIAGNWIGVDATGLAALNNTTYGIYLAGTKTTQVGGTNVLQRNIIANSTTGLVLTGNSTFAELGEKITVLGNYIGVGKDGKTPMPNTNAGILALYATDSQIGDGTTEGRNVISGNTSSGVILTGYTASPTSFITVKGNYIGVAADGTTAVGNGRSGISIAGESSNHTIQYNTIANNTGDGVEIAYTIPLYVPTGTPTQNGVQFNRIFKNGELGIDIGGDNISINDADDSDSGPNNILNFPLFKSVEILDSNLVVKGCAPTGATVDIYESDVSPTTATGQSVGANQFTKSQDYGEGEFHLVSLTEGTGEDSVTTPVDCSSLVDVDGNSASGMSPFQWSVPLPTGVVLGDSLTATATYMASSASGGTSAVIIGPTTTMTSEFSPVKKAVAGNHPPVITSNGGGDTAAISINEETTAVTTVTATDADNDPITYSISGGADAARFSINASTGVLQLLAPPIYGTPTDANSDNIYEVQISAKDNKGGEDMQAISVTIINTSTAVITGTVFDDVNYGGGAGRAKSSTGSTGVGGAVVELYNSTGTLVRTQTTTSTGTYTFNYLKAGDYYVRVVNDTVNSSRAGSNGSELGIQTYRTNGTTAVTNEVGGRVKTVNDSPANTGTQVLDTTAFTLAGNTVQTVQPMTVTTTTISGVDFGFNFSTVTNTNNAGQGSLRQFILNSNLLSKTGMNQADNLSDNASDPAAGVETAIFALTGAGPHIISLTSPLPAITNASTAIDASTQSGASCTIRTLKIVLDGTNAGAGASGITVDANNVTLRALVFSKFTDAGITGTANADNLKVGCSNIGLAADGSTVASNGTHGIWIKAGANNVTIGGSSTNDRNVISSNTRDGIRFEGVTNSTIERNYIGTNGAGSSSRSNDVEGTGYSGVSLNSTSTGIAIRNNVISGNSATGGVAPVLNVTSGIRIDTNSANITITGNLIGTTAAGTAVLANSGYGIYTKSATDIVIGGTAATDRNIISGNSKDGIATRFGTARISILGNYIGTDINGTAAISNGENGVYIADTSTATVGNGLATGRNIIANNVLTGLRNSTSNGTVITGNYVGLDTTGKVLMGNNLHGIYVQNSANVRIGGSTLAERNVISGNKTIGVFLVGATTNTRLENNLVGLGADGDTALGNTQAGIETSATTGVVITNNIVSGNGTRGVHIVNSNSTTISSNTIGLNEAGTAKRGNTTHGIDLDPPTDTAIISSNLISGNGKQGINVIAGTTATTTITGNWIGLGKNGTTPLGNTESGIRIEAATGVVVGGTGATDANTIAFNGTDGITVLGANSNNNTISRNAIYGNSGLGIDLDDNDVTLNDGVAVASTGNKGLNFPQFYQIGFDGTNLILRGCAPEGSTIELFESDISSTSSTKAAAGSNRFGRTLDYGEGERYLQTFVEGTGEDVVTKDVNCATLTDADGNSAADMKPFKWTVVAPSNVTLGDTLTATATLATIGTSEFSPVSAVVVPNDPPEITSNGGGDTATIAMPESEQSVTTVTATDPESDPITYSIGTGADASLFVINISTGALQFKNMPNFEFPLDANKDNSYEVQVVATDDKGATDKQLLTINVTNVFEQVTLKMRGFLQGPYRKDSDLMLDTLRIKNYLPLTQPYTKAPYSYTGTETMNPSLLSVTGFSAVVDWVLLELRSSTSKSTVIGRKAALLLRSGDVVEADTGSTNINFNEVDNGEYYVALRHRNHLGVMSGKALALSKSPIMVDFGEPTTSVEPPIYQSCADTTTSRFIVGSRAVMWAGDVNKDSMVAANGPANDPNFLLGNVLMATGNTYFNSNYIIDGYSSTDLDMNGYTLFAGPSNDLNLLIGSVLLHSCNSTSASNFIIQTGLPTK